MTHVLILSCKWTSAAEFGCRERREFLLTSLPSRLNSLLLGPHLQLASRQHPLKGEPSQQVPRPRRWHPNLFPQCPHAAHPPNLVFSASPQAFLLQFPGFVPAPTPTTCSTFSFQLRKKPRIWTQAYPASPPGDPCSLLPISLKWSGLTSASTSFFH